MPKSNDLNQLSYIFVQAIKEFYSVEENKVIFEQWRHNRDQTESKTKSEESELD